VERSKDHPTAVLEVAGVKRALPWGISPTERMKFRVVKGVVWEVKKGELR
jgi:hypothetical protein